MGDVLPVMRWIWAGAVLAAGCNPQAFDELTAPTDAATGPVETEGMDAASEPDDTGSPPDPAPSEGEDAASDAEDAEPEAPEPDAAEPDAPEPDAGSSETCLPPPPADHVFKVKATRALGTLPSAAAPVFRSLSGSARLGDRILWSFHNALFAADPLVAHPSAAFSSLDAPLELTELAGADGVPLPLVQRLPEEDPSVYALDPGCVVATSEHAALVFFTRIAYIFPVAVGVAHLDAQGASMRDPALLFSDGEPLFFRGGFTHADFLYLYSDEPRENDANSPLSSVVRAPVLEAAKRASYRAWSADEQAWVPDLQKRTAVLSRARGALSVSYNRYLGGYLAVFSAQSGDAIELELAPAPQGPFRALARVKTEASPFADLHTYHAQQHSVLSSACDRRIVLSYTLPAERLATELGAIATAGETRLLELELE